MDTLRPDAFVRVTLKTTRDGGRMGPLPRPRFNCPVFFGDQREHANDCMFLVEEADGELVPGGAPRIVPVKFLAIGLVRDELRPGNTFVLWEGREVGWAKVVDVTDP
ncbi:MAG: hypothetical protein H6700_02615 [Myxococcales bacterium]|nr:hypothetical protein [Myxococcales bacterium]MCB9519637.1 hypothetical protein [Myxococcales bacterium]MCB9530632.1 hypothetical protein [Myxococcales bacterium]